MIADPLSILITDDDVNWRETLRELFVAPRFRTLVAGDGREALDIVRVEPIHLVLLDMHMPRLTGLETVEQVREFNAQLPFILMSAKADDESLVRRAQRLHVFDVLRKPISRQRVLASVGQALERTYHLTPLWESSTDPRRG